MLVDKFHIVYLRDYIGFPRQRNGVHIAGDWVCTRRAFINKRLVTGLDENACIYNNFNTTLITPSFKLGSFSALGM